MEIDSVISDLYKLKKGVFSGRTRNTILGRHRSRIIGRGYRIKKISRWRRGDPFHLIDWFTTLRRHTNPKMWPNEIYKTETIEAKEVPVFLVVDTSPSMLVRFKDDDSKFILALKAMATLGFTGMYFGDPVGIASFGQPDDIFMLPKYGKRRIITVAEVLLEGADNFYKTLRKGKLRQIVPSADINECLAEVLSRVKRQSLVVVISDFVDVLYGNVKLDEDILSGLVARHQKNVVFLMVDDAEELSWSSGIGTVMTKNTETGRLCEVRASHAEQIRAEHAQKQFEFQKYLEDHGIDSLVLSSNNWHDRLSEFATGR